MNNSLLKPVWLLERWKLKMFLLNFEVKSEEILAATIEP
jgi:hypothetical protein